MNSMNNKIFWLASTVAIGLGTWCDLSADHGKYIYIQTNDIRENKNAVLGFERMENGSLTPLAGNPFYTGGTGMNNDTHGKLGTHDNDTPVIISDNGMHLFAVNMHSNTVAVFEIANNGALSAVAGSPFSSHGIAPNSLSQSGETLVVANRNGDYHQLDALRGGAKASYVSFKYDRNSGELTFVSKIDVDGFQKPTQVHISQTNPAIAFGNDFQVDADFDGDGSRSVLVGPEPRVQGQLHVFRLGHNARMTELQRIPVPETNADFQYKGMAEVPTTPLGIWSHPTKDLLYVGLVTRNELGTFRFRKSGQLEFLNSIPIKGQDICWALPNKAGTRLYAINNLPRTDLGQTAATVTTYDISEERAEHPVEIGVLELPLPGGHFVNNRMFEQPDSTAFQCALAPEGDFLYVICQRINQTAENKSEAGNYIHSLRIDQNGLPQIATTHDLLQDGVNYRSRPQGVATITMHPKSESSDQERSGTTWTAPNAERFSDYVDTDGEIRLPENFRRDWVNIGNWAIAKKQGQDINEFHDVYTPKEVVDLFNETGKWPDGAPIVKELRHAVSSKLNTGWAAREGETKLWFVMIKDSENRFQGHKDWGIGWGWAQFNADDPAKNVSVNYRISCRGCHTPRKDQDWVFIEGYPLLKQPNGK